MTVDKNHLSKAIEPTGKEPAPMTSHTPGPWRIDDEHNVFAGEDDTIMVWVSAPGKFDGDDPEIIANARLISAAPEMLEALRLVEKERPYLLEEMQNLTCADLCDKTYEQQGCPSGTCAREEGIAGFKRTTQIISAAIAKAENRS